MRDALLWPVPARNVRTFRSRRQEVARSGLVETVRRGRRGATRVDPPTGSGSSVASREPDRDDNYAHADDQSHKSSTCCLGVGHVGCCSATEAAITTMMLFRSMIRTAVRLPPVTTATNTARRVAATAHTAMAGGMSSREVAAHSSKCALNRMCHDRGGQG